MKYDLDKLGCVDFEGLSQTLVAARLGMGVEAWGGSGDWGCDAFFSGKLRYPTKTLESGPFVFQAKFVVAANAAGARPSSALLAAVIRECQRIRVRLAPAPTRKRPKWEVPPKHYILITNATVGPELRQKIESQLRKVLPETEIHVHGGNNVCAWISSQADILQAFPQLFTTSDWKLFVSAAVNAGIYTRSKTALSLAEYVARVFVPTAAYYEALQKLTEHHFVILEGPPEMGKTAIGRMIAMTQAAQKWDAIECRTPKEVNDVFDVTRPQVFIADDFFGRGEYEPSRMSAWEGELPFILNRLDTQHWLILTSRAHILKIGQRDLDVSGQNHRFPQLGEVVVNAGRLNEIEKGKILYRHAKAAGLSESVREYIRHNAEDIVSNSHFTPLRIKNFVAALRDSF